MDTTSPAKSVTTRNGITLHQSTVNDIGSEIGYGHWGVLNHSGFSVGSLNSTRNSDGSLAWSRYSYAAGDTTGTRPTATATWTGAMVGMPAGEAGRTNILNGDATLTYDPTASTLDARFTGIRNITTNRDHAVTSVGFDDVRVFSDGSFHDGLPTNRITGAFFGPGHAETAGVFEKRGIVGAFGANRQ